MPSGKGNTEYIIPEEKVVIKDKGYRWLVMAEGAASIMVAVFIMGIFRLFLRAVVIPRGGPAL